MERLRPLMGDNPPGTRSLRRSEMSAMSSKSRRTIYGGGIMGAESAAISGDK
jgi:hypothetical protein